MTSITPRSVSARPARPRTVGRTVRRKPTRSPEALRAALLAAAVVEFAREGYGGARVDRISRAAKSNDRMLYYYFKSKEKLFHAVIEHCYAALVASEEALALPDDPEAALAQLVAFNWDYYWEHPELLSVLASENLFKGRHVKNAIRRSFASSQFALLERVLGSGSEKGIFRENCDSFLIYMSILSLTYFYRSNLYTLSNYMQVDLAAAERKAKWLAHVQAMIADSVRRR